MILTEMDWNEMRSLYVAVELVDRREEMEYVELPGAGMLAVKFV
jgi:hypothetical protein